MELKEAFRRRGKLYLVFEYVEKVSRRSFRAGPRRISTPFSVGQVVLFFFFFFPVSSLEHAGAAGGAAQRRARREGTQLHLPADQGHPLVPQA